MLKQQKFILYHKPLQEYTSLDSFVTESYILCPKVRLMKFNRMKSEERYVILPLQLINDHPTKNMSRTPMKIDSTLPELLMSKSRSNEYNCTKTNKDMSNCHNNS